MTEATEPRRLRWSVPAADSSTNRWLDSQDNISVSLRLLIRESIQRDGYVDVMNKPVEQQPRRGRPPGDHREQGRPPGGPQEQGRPPGASLPESDVDGTDDSPVSGEAGDDPSISEPAEEQVQVPETEGTGGATDEDGQIDMNSLMAGLRAK